MCFIFACHTLPYASRADGNANVLAFRETVVALGAINDACTLKAHEGQMQLMKAVHEVSKHSAITLGRSGASALLLKVLCYPAMTLTLEHASAALCEIARSRSGWESLGCSADTLATMQQLVRCHPVLKVRENVASALLVCTGKGLVTVVKSLVTLLVVGKTLLTELNLGVLPCDVASKYQVPSVYTCSVPLEAEAEAGKQAGVAFGDRTGAIKYGQHLKGDTSR